MRALLNKRVREQTNYSQIERSYNKMDERLGEIEERGAKYLNRTHGVAATYRIGCRCSECRAANTRAVQEYRARLSA